MTRVLHVISGLGTGGTEGVLSRMILSSPSNLIHGVVSLSGRGVYGDRLAEAGIPVWVAAMPKGFPTPRFRQTLKKAVREFKPDVVSGWLYRGNWASLRASKDAGGVPVVWNIRHSLHDWKRERMAFRFTVWMNRKLSNRPAVVVYNSAVAQKQHRDFGFSESYSRVIANGFDLKKFCPDAQARREYRKQWDAADDQIVVGLVARWHPTKNHRGFIEAAQSLQQEFPRSLFVLAGDGCTEQNSELSQSLAGLGLTKAFRLLGRVDQPEKVIAAFDVSVSASFGEAFSNAVGESMACGVPCVATDVGDAQHIMGPYGVVVSVEHLSDGLAALLRKGQNAFVEMGRQARIRIEENFPLIKMNKEYADLYESISRSRT